MLNQSKLYLGRHIAFLYAYGFIEATTFAENTSFNEDMRQRPQPIFPFLAATIHR